MEKKKVLIVDDEEALVKFLARRLEANHYEVVTALRGDEGLEKAEREKPDLIILDVMMPVMDGYTFVREMKSAGNETPIIMLTAKEKMEDLFQMEGVPDYLIKPCDSEALLEKIEQHIGAANA